MGILNKSVDVGVLFLAFTIPIDISQRRRTCKNPCFYHRCQEWKTYIVHGIIWGGGEGGGVFHVCNASSRFLARKRKRGEMNGGERCMK